MLYKIKQIVRGATISLKISYLRFRGANIHKTAKISLKSSIDLTNPRGIHIKEGAYIALNSIVLSHDFVRGIHTNTVIGKNSFIGAGCIILPGVEIGDHCVCAAGSVVTKSIPAHCIAAGNPAKVIRTGINTKLHGQIIES